MLREDFVKSLRPVMRSMRSKPMEVAVYVYPSNGKNKRAPQGQKPRPIRRSKHGVQKLKEGDAPLNATQNYDHFPRYFLSF